MIFFTIIGFITCAWASAGIGLMLFYTRLTSEADTPTYIKVITLFQLAFILPWATVLTGGAPRHAHLCSMETDE